MISFQSLLKKYDYQLPESFIAQQPAAPRDHAKLLVFRKFAKNEAFNKFYNLPNYLPANSVLVFNHTRVLPARFSVLKNTGGSAEILFVEKNKKFLKTLCNKKLPANQTVRLLQNPNYKFLVAGKQNRHYLLKPLFAMEKWLPVLNKFGKMPLPPYIKHSSLNEKQKRDKYQTVFARSGKSIAAPTASLHFTKRLMQNLKQKGIAVKFVRLDVGLGTFAPLQEGQVRQGRLHREFYSIDPVTAAYLNKAKETGRPIIAVGTTVTRTLESAVRAGRLSKLSGETSLFIQEGYEFQFVRGLITNFHVPRSSLLMLVSAFAGRKNIFRLYRKAMEKDFKFFSFGDSMLILP
ncbi:MAG: tRNA preQ1(34) S-adenosylmethionine ribosyltransferase-isomerase QueA [Patescibacteria group bacterium]|nr:tRNA preQ1(34) S-adenosylmethionine ribosyltransferase-isomerase QueA [Patescibacteria group bacterium]